MSLAGSGQITTAGRRTRSALDWPAHGISERRCPDMSINVRIHPVIVVFVLELILRLIR